VNKVALFCLGQGLVRKDNYSLTERFLGFLTLVPPIYLVLTPINAASAVVLSIGGFPVWNKAIVGLVTVALAGWGINALNHYIDRDRDKVIWPERSLPAGRVSSGTALISAIISFIAALSLSWFIFNPENFIILLIAIILGIVYSVYFRDKFGYLSLPPVPGLIYLGGWAAFSPGTLWSALPVCLYLLGFLWQAAHITIYYPLHSVNDSNGNPINTTPLLAGIRPSSKAASKIGLCFTVLTILLSIALVFIAPLGWIYIILVLGAGIYALVTCVSFTNSPLDRKSGYKAFAALSIFRLVISVAILFDVLIYYRNW
jgi:heme o synthase